VSFHNSAPGGASHQPTRRLPGCQRLRHTPVSGAGGLAPQSQQPSGTGPNHHARARPASTPERTTDQSTRGRPLLVAIPKRYRPPHQSARTQPSICQRNRSRRDNRNRDHHAIHCKTQPPNSSHASNPATNVTSSFANRIRQRLTPSTRASPSRTQARTHHCHHPSQSTTRPAAKAFATREPAIIKLNHGKSAPAALATAQQQSSNPPRQDDH
jgi:hypothetical protein